MQSIEEFMEAYFRERTALLREQKKLSRPHFERFFGIAEPFSRTAVEESEAERILSVQQPGNIAHVITNGSTIRNIKAHQRYSIEVCNQNWVIRMVDVECIRCGGSGKLRENSCNVCKGKGWIPVIGKSSE
jgi:hypothetical protein